MNTLSAADRLTLARLSLDGLSVGDALGTALGEFGNHDGDAERRHEPSRHPWATTDDTEMGIAVVETLESQGLIDSDELAQRFAARFVRDPDRGYGGGARKLLLAYARGGRWQDLAGNMFNGQGSKGNGSAMRAMPIGAYFADDPKEIVENATQSALPTHAHPEGVAGAVIAALAAGWATRRAQDKGIGSLFDFVLPHAPKGAVHTGVVRAMNLSLQVSAWDAAHALGFGRNVLAEDTVPFALWVCARHPDSFEDALWTVATPGGDRDTLCAIVGGIVALSAGRESIPQSWLHSRESLSPTQLDRDAG
ncbi:MAG: ADP-ribosylglycohydrolase family protein [Deltaproteobacteria bacterium]|nr:ADP-ribosylglycohydrolase family protein [Deltaproteobacteria bacterium]